MVTRNRLLISAAAALLLALCAGQARAAVVRYHYVPGPPESPSYCLDGARGTTGERLTWRLTWEPYNCPPPRTTCYTTFRHPCTGQSITVPLSLPPDTPRMEYRGNRTIYDYGSYEVEVEFLPDGTVNVIYNSGLLRAP